LNKEPIGASLKKNHLLYSCCGEGGVLVLEIKHISKNRERTNARTYSL